jgi:hypothetical protein
MCLDEHRRELFQRGSIERRQRPAAQLVEVGQFGAPVVGLGAYGVELEPFELGALAGASLDVGGGFLEAFQVRLGSPALHFVGDHDASPFERWMTTMPLDTAPR